MTRTLAIATAALVAGVAFTPPAGAQQRQNIRIVGSSTVFPFSTTVAEHFARETRFPAPVVESTGSGGGLNLFCQGVGTQHPDITNASRRIKQSEMQLCNSNGVNAITEVKIGFDGIVLAAAKDQRNAMNLTEAQLWQALAKQVPQNGQLVNNPYTRWNQIDSSLPNEPIEVYGPPPTSGTRDAFVELVMEKGCEEFDAVKQLSGDRKTQVCSQMREDGVYIEAGENDNLIVQKLVSNPQARGIFGFRFLDQNRDKLQAAQIEGTAPTFETISSGDYPVSRSLYFYVKNAHVGTVPGIKEYIAEFTNARAWGPDGYLADKGLIPLPEDQREKVRQAAMNLQPLTL